MRRALVLVALAAGCGGADDDSAPPAPDAGVPFTECDGTDQAFVRQATLALLGRRPRSQAEVQVHADLMAQARALGDSMDGESMDAGPPDTPALDPREVVARALLDDPGYVDRWTEHVMDALKVPRIEDQSQRTCYGASARAPERGIDDGSLALAVRGGAARTGGDERGRFTLLDLLRSALHLDDLSVVYRAHLYALVTRPIPAANVPPIEAELARREDFGLLFDATYLNRDLVCLGCHNSEASVTFHPDPALNRHWPVPGLFETAIYGDAYGIATERAHAPFRYTGLVVDPSGENGEAILPWGWDRSCGAFDPDGIEADPAGVDGKLASLSGELLTVFDLEEALARGFASLADGGLATDESGTIADPDAAMAYLVAAAIVEGVWREVIGTPLTIANYFPRNQVARDLLAELTSEFIANRYSLRELLVDIVTSDYFNRLPPEAGCGTGPYNMPALYDPWVTSDPDPARRENGAGDAVAALSPRVLLRAAHDALEWPRPFYYAFPEESPAIQICSETYTCQEMASACEVDGTCCDAYELECTGPTGDQPAPDQLRAFERGIGIFLKHGEKGFRGLDFQARLVFEDAFGACANPAAPADFVADLVARAQASPDATIGDLVAALKDRLIGQARISHRIEASGVSELAAIEELFDAEVSTAVSDVDALEAKSRALCGVLLSSPLFLLGGIAAPDSAYIPTLTPEPASYRSICANLAERGLSGALILTCSDSALSLSRDE
jgi:hypothetical protein